MSDEIMSLEDFQLIDAAPEGFSSQTFVINDEGQATWAMRRLASAQRHIDAVKRQADEEHDRIDRWFAHATKSDQSTVEYFTEVLGNYVKRLRVEDGRKSIYLPDGTVKSREVKETFKVEDADAFFKWVDESPELAAQWVRLKREPDITTIKAGVVYSDGLVVDSATGETIDGLVHVPGGVSVTVEVSE